MVTHYLTIAIRHLLKSKLNFAFKLVGLTLALTGLLVIVMYVSYHLSFDTYHKDYKSIFRVNAKWMENGALASYAIVPPAVGPALEANFPEVETAARIGYPGHYLVRYKDRSLRIHGFVDADSTVFDVLHFKFLAGDRRALDHSGSIVLTRSLAREIFDDEDPIGKIIAFTDRADQTLQVTAVIDDPPANTHLDVRALTSMGSLIDESAHDEWGIGIDGSVPLYVKLRGNADPDQFAAKAIPFLRSRLTSGEGSLERHYEIYLQPIHKIHLDPWIFADFTRKGNVAYVYAFSLLGLFLLVIGGINYVNLSIADYNKRSKEMGIRKVLGARVRQVSFQVVAETVTICVLAILISIALLYIALPEIRTHLEGQLTFAMLFESGTLSVIGIILLLLIAVASVYPAWHLARNKPVRDLQSIGTIGSHGSGSFLLGIQFIVSAICICATLIVSKQIQFFQTKDPGYDRHNAIVLYMPDHYPPEKIPVIRNELAQLQGVEAVSYSTFRIAAGGYYRDWYRVEIDGEMKQMLLNEVFFDHEFFRTAGIDIIAGRNFDSNNPADAHSAFIVNESAVRSFGWKDPIGKRISYGYETPSEGERWEGTIVGVVRDFNVYSMHRKIEPLVMRLPWSDWPGSCVHIRISGPFKETIARIEDKYAEIMPDFLIHYSLLTDLYESQYQNEQKAYMCLTYATWIIALISAFGIFSLSLFLSIRRMKEFGIRKVLGATVRQIAFLHIRHFIKIAIIANAIALPLAWWLTEQWLSQFAYRIEAGALTFLIVIFISLILVTISAGHASLRSALMNPVDVIRNE